MKKSYIVLVILSVFGAAALIVYPSKRDDTSAPSSTSDISDSKKINDQPVVKESSPVAQNDVNQSINDQTYKNGTYEGTVETTPYGDLAISIIIQNGKIETVNLIKMPDADRQSVRISQQSGSVLVSQTLQSQSADIDGVSGATYTSDAYINSLQSAIDAAKAV